MPINEFNFYAEEKKLPNGKRYECDACKQKSEVIYEVDDMIGSKRKKTDDPLDQMSNQWTINDVMLKLLEMEKRYNDLFVKYEQQVQVNNELRNEVRDLKKQLNREVNRSEQQNLKNNVIINGIPNKTSEDPKEIVRKMASTMQVKLNMDNVTAYRFGRRNGTRSAPIKVIFSMEQDKACFMQAKKTKAITVPDLGFSETGDIFINHDMTRENQNLYKEARQFKKDNAYKYVWFKDGKVFLRKDEKSKVLLIEDQEDLKNL